MESTVSALLLLKPKRNKPELAAEHTRRKLELNESVFVTALCFFSSSELLKDACSPDLDGTSHCLR
jgi:hypothetical protein